MPGPTYQEPNWGAKGNPVNSDIRTEGQNWIGQGGKRIQRVLFENGETWDIPDEGDAKLVDLNPSMASAWRQTHPTDTGKAPSAWPSSQYITDPKTGEPIINPQPAASSDPNANTSAWSVQTRPDGSKVRVNELTGDIQPMAGFEAPQEDPETAALKKRLLTAQVGTSERSAAGITSAPQKAPRWPEEVEADQLKNQLTQRGMYGDLQGQQQSHEQNIDTIKQMIASGQIDANEGDRLLAMSRRNLGAATLGTTPWNYQQNREKVAGDTLGNNLQYGTSFATSLMNAASKRSETMLSSANPPQDYSPLLLAKRYIEDLGGGQQLSDLARAVLAGAMGGER